MERKITKRIFVGDVPIGEGAPIAVQSMINTVTKDIASSVKLINELSAAGCDIVRGAVSDLDDAKAIPEIIKNTTIPFVADIQFDYRLALAAAENGAHCLRINPGNIGSDLKIREIVEACKYYDIPIRIGVNSGSVNQKFIDKYGGVNEDSMVYSALTQVELFESMGFTNMKIAIKSSEVPICIEAYKKISSLCNYPLHLGVTEAGPFFRCCVKSSVGIGTLLSMGIGDTIRVSLTGNPVDEVKIGKEILKSLGLLQEGIDLISCPTCGRTKIKLEKIAKEVEKRLEDTKKNIKVAIMGCPVNGPGEAKNADIGISGGNGKGIIFVKGEVVKKVPEENLIEELIKEIEKL